MQKRIIRIQHLPTSPLFRVNSKVSHSLSHSSTGTRLKEDEPVIWASHTLSNEPRAYKKDKNIHYHLNRMTEKYQKLLVITELKLKG